MARSHCLWHQAEATHPHLHLQLRQGRTSSGGCGVRMSSGPQDGGYISPLSSPSLPFCRPASPQPSFQKFPPGSGRDSCSGFGKSAASKLKEVWGLPKGVQGPAAPHCCGQDSAFPETCAPPRQASNLRHVDSVPALSEVPPGPNKRDTWIKYFNPNPRKTQNLIKQSRAAGTLPGQGIPPLCKRETEAKWESKASSTQIMFHRHSRNFHG